MDVDSEDALDIVSKLRQEIKNKNKDIYSAAKLGKELLERNSELENQLAEIRAENDLLKQERYSLQLDLETKSQTLNTLNSEVEILREQYDNLVKKFDTLQKENVRQKQQLNNFEKEKIDFERAQEDGNRESYMLKKKIDLLEQQLEGFHLKAEATINLGIIEDSNEENNINFYIERNKQLQDALADIQCELESVKLSENRLTNLVKELEEGIQDRDKEIASYSVEVQKARDVNTELQGEIEILKLEQLDVNRRGNSVFGELDDRRKLVEKEYKLLAKKYEAMRNEYRNMKKEITKCKGQMAILLSMTSRESQDAYINKLEDQLSDAKREIKSLTAQLSKTTKNLQDIRVELNSAGNGEYDYLRILYEKSEEAVKMLENELITARMKNMTDSDELDRIRQQLYHFQVKLDEEKLETMKLQQKIKELTPLSIDEFAPTVDKRKESDAKDEDENIPAFDKMSIVSGELVRNEKGIVCIKRQFSSTSRTPYKLSERILKESQAKAEKNNCESSQQQKDPKSMSQTHFGQHYRNRQTRKPPECAQQ